MYWADLERKFYFLLFGYVLYLITSYSDILEHTLAKTELDILNKEMLQSSIWMYFILIANWLMPAWIWFYVYIPIYIYRKKKKHSKDLCI